MPNASLGDHILEKRAKELDAHYESGVRAGEQIRADLERQLTALRKAAAPFAEAYKRFRVEHRDGPAATDEYKLHNGLTVGDLRRLKEAYDESLRK